MGFGGGVVACVSVWGWQALGRVVWYVVIGWVVVCGSVYGVGESGGAGVVGFVGAGKCWVVSGGGGGRDSGVEWRNGFGRGAACVCCVIGGCFLGLCGVQA